MELPRCFERLAAPPERFLRWLIEHSGREWNYDFKDKRRKALQSGDVDVRAEALELLAKNGARGSKGE